MAKLIIIIIIIIIIHAFIFAHKIKGQIMKSGDLRIRGAVEFEVYIRNIFVEMLS